MTNNPLTAKQLQQILQVLLQQSQQTREEIAKTLQDQQETEEKKQRRVQLQILREQKIQSTEKNQEIINILTDGTPDDEIKAWRLERVLLNLQNQQIENILADGILNENEKVERLREVFLNVQDQQIENILTDGTLNRNEKVNRIQQAFQNVQVQNIGNILLNITNRNRKVNQIRQAFQNLQDQQIRVILRDETLNKDSTVSQIQQAFQNLQDQQIRVILRDETLNEAAKVNQIQQALQNEQVQQTILNILTDGRPNDNEKINRIQQVLQNVQDQQILKIVKMLQLLQTKITEDVTTTITEDVNNELDDVIRKLVQQIKHETNPENIEKLNKKFDKLIELKDVLQNGLNYDSINTIISELVNHDNYSFIPLANRDNDDQGKAIITNAARYLYLLRNSTQSLEKPISSAAPNQFNRINDPALGLELFRTYRSRIEYEGTLLNQRVNWFLVTQGFLFAAFATALTAETGFIIFLFLLAISITGLGYSCLISNPIALSLLAVDTLKVEWINRSNPSSNSSIVTDQVKNLLPIQVCFDAEQTVPNTSTIILNGYIPNDYLIKPKSSRYRTYIMIIPRITGIVWLILLFLVINLFRSYPLFPAWLFNNSYYLTINTSTLTEDRDNINKSKAGLKAAICLTKKDKQKKYEQVLAIKPAGNPFFNLSKNSANEYLKADNESVDYVTVTVLRENNPKKLNLIRKLGKLQSCEE